MLLRNLFAFDETEEETEENDNDIDYDQILSFENSELLLAKTIQAIYSIF